MKSFTTTRRVDFGDTDMAGIVHFANFFRFMESAETEFLMSLDLSVTGRDAEGRWGLPRVAASCDYYKPARFMDVLTITVTVERIGTKSITYRFDFSNQQGEILAVGRITAVYCRTTGFDRMESEEIPAEVRAKLEGSA
jgi:YbgC/YbaW family acyl-CoA thioester hydrolase